jgi:hypothetical protein
VSVNRSETSFSRLLGDMTKSALMNGGPLPDEAGAQNITRCG